MKTLVQIQLLEKYIASNQISIDEIFATTITKLYERELKRIQNFVKHLQEQLNTFEKQYLIETTEFILKYESGKMGDNIDFVEWSATIDMLNNAHKRLNILKNSQL